MPCLLEPLGLKHSWSSLSADWLCLGEKYSVEKGSAIPRSLLHIRSYHLLHIVECCIRKALGVIAVSSSFINDRPVPLTVFALNCILSDVSATTCFLGHHCLPHPLLHLDSISAFKVLKFEARMDYIVSSRPVWTVSNKQTNKAAFSLCFLRDSKLKTTLRKHREKATLKSWPQIFPLN